MTYIEFECIDIILRYLHCYRDNISNQYIFIPCEPICNLQRKLYKTYEFYTCTTKPEPYSTGFYYITLNVYKSMTMEIEDFIINNKMLSDEQKDDICRFIYFERKCVLDTINNFTSVK